MVLSVEPRGIEPLYPSVKHGILTVRWPLKLHEEYYITFLQKRKTERLSRNFRVLIGSVLDDSSIPNLHGLSRSLVHR